MPRRHFFRLQFLGPALVGDEGTECARPLQPHNRGTRIASDIRMDEWHSRDAEVLAWMRTAAWSHAIPVIANCKASSPTGRASERDHQDPTARWLPAYVLATASLDRKSVETASDLAYDPRHAEPTRVIDPTD